MLMVDDSFLTAPHGYTSTPPLLPLHLRPLYIALVFISVHKFVDVHMHLHRHTQNILALTKIYETRVTPVE